MAHALCFPRSPKELHCLWRDHSTQVSIFLRPGGSESQVTSEELKTTSPGLHPNLLPPHLKH